MNTVAHAPTTASILHADLDSFYASVEQRDDPSLRGRPVIVGGGVVLAASYEAKAYGVFTPMGGGQARALCPHAVVVPPRFPAYVEASKAVFAVFDDVTPVVEGLSIDEAFLDVSGLRRVSGTPRAIAERLRRDVLDRVGLAVTVGVARTKFLAKVASGVAKPDGLLVVSDLHHAGQTTVEALREQRPGGVVRLVAERHHHAESVHRAALEDDPLGADGGPIAIAIPRRKANCSRKASSCPWTALSSRSTWKSSPSAPAPASAWAPPSA